MRTVTSVGSVKNSTLEEYSDNQFTVAFFLVAAVMIAPLAAIDIPLLADYPNHVARMHIIGNVDSDDLLAQRFAVSFDLIPNIAMDLVVPWLAHWLPLDAAARLFLALCLLSSLAGVAWLNRTIFNQWSLFSLLAVFFVYHGSMIAGMANFSLGIGLVPAALAVWIKLERASASRRLVAGSAMALGLYFCHLVAVGAYGLLIVGLAVARGDGPRDMRQSMRNLAIAGMTGLLPLALFLRLAFKSDGSVDAVVVYGNPAWKAKALLSPLANYHLALDLTTFALLATLALLAWIAGRITIDRRMVPGLALLAVAFVLAPKALWSGGVFDQRLATLLALMLVASARVDLPTAPLFRALPVLLALIFLLRIGALTSIWLEHRGDLAEMRRAIDLIAPGGRVLVVRPDVETAQRQAPPRHRVFHHAVQLTSLPALAVIEKSAFVSSLYALSGQQPLVLKPPFDRLGGRGHADLPTIEELTRAHRAGRDDPPMRPPIQDWTADFDYVLMIYGYGPGSADSVGDLPLQPLLDGEILDLFRIVRE